jgi:hypothetical protein
MAESIASSANKIAALVSWSESAEPSTSGSGPTMHSSLRRLPKARLSLSSQCRIRHNRRRSRSLCIRRNLCSLHSL